MDSVLQCFANNLDLASTILAYNYCTNNNWNEWDYENNTKIYVKLNDHTTPLTKAFATVLTNLYNHDCNIKFFKPDQFRNVLGNLSILFADTKANDSKDLVQFMLETLHNELNEAQPVDNVNNIIDQTNDVAMLNQFVKEFPDNYKSVISDQYYGVFKTISQCDTCKIVQYNYQTYNFLIFPLKAVHEYVSQNNYHMTNKLNLYNCFDYYNNKIENFTGDNQMYCNNCKKSHNATYQSQIVSLPNELVIVLNRGKANQDYNKPIIINDNINLSNYVTLPGQNFQYYLSGIVCHIGPSSMSGHFIAYTRNSQNGQWVKYNDGDVTPENDLKNGYQVKNDIKNILNGTTGFTPYILFYTKC